MSELPPGPRTPATVNTVRLARRPLESLAAGTLATATVHGQDPVFGTGVYVVDPRRSGSSHRRPVRSAGRRGERALEPVLGHNSVLVLDGPEHLRQRKLLLPPFQGSAVPRSARSSATSRSARSRAGAGARARHARSDAGVDVRGHLPRRVRGDRTRPGRATAGGACRGHRQPAQPGLPPAAPASRPRAAEPRRALSAAAARTRTRCSTRRSRAAA